MRAPELWKRAIWGPGGCRERSCTASCTSGVQISVHPHRPVGCAVPDPLAILFRNEIVTPRQRWHAECFGPVGIQGELKMTTKRPRIVSPFALAAGAALALSAPPRGGHAFEAPKTPACYATAPNWNAANGALVSGISPGVIQLLFQALGQTRTHVMLANNTPDGQMATESTGLVPSIHTIPLKLCVAGFICKTVQIPDPSMPLEPVQVAQGSPGFSQINMG